MGIAFASEGWQWISISAEALGLTDGHLVRIRLTGDVEGTFYIDDMRLVAEEVPEPPGPDTAVEVSEGKVLPSGYALSQNYPNPFNPSTTIAYALPRTSDVTLTLYTITGQKVLVLTDGYQPSGHHTVHFDGSRLATGVYLYRLEAEGLGETKRMVLLR